MPAEQVYVFDACAVVALLQEEDGMLVVEGLLGTVENRCLLPVINACEVYYHLYRQYGERAADSLGGLLASYGFELEERVPEQIWRQAGKLKGEWRRVSLADSFALATAIHYRGTLVTSDHHELDQLVGAVPCPILFIR